MNNPFSIDRTAYTSELALQWLADYLRESPVAVAEEAFKYTPALLAEVWSKAAPASEGDVLGFYKSEITGRLYLFDLLIWNHCSLFKKIQAALLPCRDQRVLEIGGGIGTIAIQLALQGNNVVTIEPNKLLRGFIQHRWDWTRSKLLPYSSALIVVPSMPRLEPSIEAKSYDAFNVCVAIDVFEHIHGDVLPDMLMQIGTLLASGGDLFTHNTWEIQETYPMHFNHSAHWREWVEDAGFEFINEFRSVKK